MPMTLPASPLALLVNEVSKLRFRLKHATQRYGVAWRYARGRNTADDGMRLLYDAEAITGIYGLACLSVASVLARARDLYGDVPGLATWAADACARVNQKNDGDYGEIIGAAEDWALDLMVEYAGHDGVTLTELDHDTVGQDERALAEGWCLIEGAGGLLEIDADADSPIFFRDNYRYADEAAAFVRQKAADGSAYHIAALARVGQPG